MRIRRRDLLQKFFADRGPHLAAMIAYFALLSFVPLTFLSLALLGLTGRADESSFLVREIKKTLPGTPIDQIVNLVHAVQDNAATLGIVGGVALLWTACTRLTIWSIGVPGSVFLISLTRNEDSSARPVRPRRARERKVSGTKERSAK